MRIRELSTVILGYIRVSTEEQDVNKQRLAIHDYAQKNKLHIDDFVEITISSRKSNTERRIDELKERLNSGDTLIVAELSRLGRSLSQIVSLVDVLRANGVRIIAIKESIDTGKNDIATKVQIAMFGLFAEIERDLLSQRTKEGLARAKKEGVKLGRPKGSLGQSKLDGKEDEIRKYLKLGLNNTAIAKLMECSRPTLINFMKTRKLIRG